MAKANPGRAQGVHHHRPDVGHRVQDGAGAGEARHGRPGRAATRESSTRCARRSSARAGMRCRSCATCRISRAYGARPRRSSRSVFRSRAWSTTRAPCQARATKNAQGWDMVFATNHLGPFALTEALMPHLPDGANVVFVCSGVEDPERRPAVIAGFRGGRYISAEASARGEWKPGGSARPGFDAYATSKQCNLATVLAFARETPRLRFNAVEPGFSPATSLGRDANVLPAPPEQVRAGAARPVHQVLEHPGSGPRRSSRTSC